MLVSKSHKDSDNDKSFVNKKFYKQRKRERERMYEESDLMRSQI